MPALLLVAFIYYSNYVSGLKDSSICQFAGDFQVDIAYLKDGLNISAGESGRRELRQLIDM